MKSIKTVSTVIALAVVFTSGCATLTNVMEEIKARQAAKTEAKYRAYPDQAMAEAFRPRENEAGEDIGYNCGGRKACSVKIADATRRLPVMSIEYVTGYDYANPDQFFGSIGRQDRTGDTVGQTFIDTALARGHIVKIYGPVVNHRLEKFVNRGTRTVQGDINYIYSAERDRAMIEYDRANQPVNILTREIFYNTTIVNVQNTGSVKGYVWSGEAARQAITRIGSRQIEAHLERVVTR